MFKLQIDVVAAYPGASGSAISPFTDPTFPHLGLYRTYWQNSDDLIDLEMRIGASGLRFDQIYFSNGEDALRKLNAVRFSAANHFLRSSMIRTPTSGSPSVLSYHFTFAMNLNGSNVMMLNTFGANFRPSSVRVISNGVTERNFNF